MPKRTVKSIEQELRDFALTFPETTEDHPWNHVAVKVRGKMFVVFSGPTEPKTFRMTAKLPQSRDLAFDLPFASPTGYGLGKSGWVTAELFSAADVPVDLMKAWIRESYCAVAPKKLVKTLV